MSVRVRAFSVDCLQLFLSTVILRTSTKRSGISVPRFYFIIAQEALEGRKKVAPDKNKGLKNEEIFNRTVVLGSWSIIVFVLQERRR